MEKPSIGFDVLRIISMIHCVHLYYTLAVTLHSTVTGEYSMYCTVLKAR